MSDNEVDFDQKRFSSKKYQYIMSRQAKRIYSSF